MVLKQVMAALQCNDVHLTLCCGPLKIKKTKASPINITPVKPNFVLNRRSVNWGSPGREESLIGTTPPDEPRAISTSPDEARLVTMHSESTASEFGTSPTSSVNSVASDTSVKSGPSFASFSNPCFYPRLQGITVMANKHVSFLDQSALSDNPESFWGMTLCLNKVSYPLVVSRVDAELTNRCSGYVEQQSGMAVSKRAMVATDIKVGDCIYFINGLNTAHLSFAHCMQILRQEITVTLLLEPAYSAAGEGSDLDRRRVTLTKTEQYSYPS